jgi:RNA polymerase sigma-70 factor, ECF subfamily
VEPDAVETDEQLIARWSSGRDRSARDALIGRYLPRFYGTARAMLARVVEAEDIAQEAMLKVVVALDRFDGRSTFQAWSYAILLNTVRTSLRQGKQRGQKLERVADMGSVAAPECALERRLSGEETNSILEAAMQKLSEKQRVAVVLILMEGLSAAEVAEMEECSVDAVYQRVADARRVLRSEVSLQRVWLGE